MSAATISQAGSFADTTTAPPSRAKRCASAAPMPRLAPVMTTVLPSKRDISTSLGGSDGSQESLGRELIGDQDVDESPGQTSTNCLGLSFPSSNSDDARCPLQLFKRHSDHAVIKRSLHGASVAIEKTQADVADRA